MPEVLMDPYSMDKEHEILLGLLANLRQCTNSRASDVGIDQVLHFACEHFAHEEALMGVLPATIRDAHCQAHETIAGKLVEIKMANLHRAHISEQMIEVVENWLNQHIEVHDAVLQDYLKKAQA